MLVEREQEVLAAQARELREAHARELEAQAREAILDLCIFLAIEVTAEQRARMEAMTGEELTALRSALRRQRRWPEEL